MYSTRLRCGVAALLAVVTLDIVAGGPLHSGFPADSQLSDDPYRLPRHVLPRQYTLQLEPNLDPEYSEPVRKFSGHVTILVDVKQATDTITLHALHIDITTASVKKLDEEGIVTDEELRNYHEFVSPYDFLVIHLKETVPIGLYMIDITYTGTLWEDMYGFYISTYTENDKEKLLVATQFQATHARKAFPCFDEPSFKANFEVTIIAPQGMTVLGNMPEKEINVADGKQRVTFQNTMLMSSYLLAFVVSPFTSIKDEGEGESDVLFETWARRDAVEWGRYSLEVSRKMLHTLEEYTQIKYSEAGINKVDQVALPDFAAGAMENWGLITYRETALLYYDGSADAKKRVATVIAHELLHMWFGNLVTTEWWDTTWLNEGFARFFQYYVTDEVEDTWRMWDQFLVDQHQMVFALDALATAKALTHHVSTPGEVSASFGSITYNKGASILRMIRHTIGADNFKSALQVYLKENEYSTVVPIDLFEKLKVYAAIANLSEEDFEEFLISWTETPGFPVINVKRDYENSKCSITQERFLVKGKGSEQYYVPITWTKRGGGFNLYPPKEYLKPGRSLEVVNMPSKDEWVIFNVQETGFYRVNYDKENWELLAKDLHDADRPIDEIHVLNRAQLLDDAFNLARAGRLDYETAFRLADYLPRETDYLPWAAAITAFSYIDRMLVNHPKYPVLQRYILRLVDKTFARQHVNFFDAPEEHIEKLFYNKIATMACSNGHQTCYEGAALELRRYLSGDIESIPADRRSYTYCYGIRYLPTFAWRLLWEIYTESKDDVERGLLINGLSCSYDESLLTEILQHTIEGKFIRKQDASSVFAAVYSNPTGVNVALQFLDENFEEISNYYGSKGTVGNIVTGIAGRLTSSEQQEKLQNFVSKYSEELGGTGPAAVDIVEDNIRWLNAHEKEIFSILDEKELKLHRLPQDISPLEYILHIDAELGITSYLGEVTIFVRAKKNTDTITLHASNVKASQISVYEYPFMEKDIYFTSTYDEYLRYQYIYLSERLYPWSLYIIHIKFYAFFRYDMYGFYKSTYEDENGITRVLGATQFQPTHARSAFPCFDEPTHKSVFIVSVKTPPKYHALGNMAVRLTKVWEDGRTEVEFFPTPPMPTYLLAFVVSDFQYVEDARGDIIFRTWSHPNALPWANYSLVVSRDILEALEDYTVISYSDQRLDFPFTKVDQVALPDFSAGAMENWGLVTYRETALLYNDGTAPARKSVATIIAHELAHMWFGNLVTTDWWDATWLNEGFAQYLQFFITDKVKPSWRLMDQFLVDHHQAVFASDSLVTAAALTSPAYTPAQVSARFSGITYSKGASILRMLSAILGEDIFKEVLETYLNTHSYSTTKPEDLFEEFTKKSAAASLNAIHFLGLLRSWTEKAGFPVVRVSRVGNSGTVEASQTRFLLKKPAVDSNLYYVPLTWTVEGGNFSLRRPQAYITDEQKSVTIDTGGEPNKWIIFNVQETGYYRVNYDVSDWKLISDYLVDTSKPLGDIHILNRAQLLDDAFNLARAGQLSYQTAIDISDYLSRETDYVPWASALAAFAYLQRMLIHEERYVYFKNYVLHLVGNLYSHYEFKDRHEHIDKLLLNRISAWACSLQHKDCTEAASAALRDYVNDEKIVPADLRSVTYCYGIRHSSSEYWDKMWQKYKESKDNAEKSIIMSGLACSHEETKLEQLLYSSISEDGIRRQDASSVFTAVYGNSLGVNVALEFLDNHFVEVQEFYGSMGAINNIVVGLAGRLTTIEQQTKMRDFATKYEDFLGSTAGYALETVEENLQWLEENAKAILDILEDHNPPTLPLERTTTIQPITSTTETISGETTTSKVISPETTTVEISSTTSQSTTSAEITTSTPTTTTGYAPRIGSSFALAAISILLINGLL